MGPYCDFCGNRCFVERVYPKDSQWKSTFMATCSKGMEHDQEKTGYDCNTALNPVSDPRFIDSPVNRVESVYRLVEAGVKQAMGNNLTAIGAAMSKSGENSQATIYVEYLDAAGVPARCYEVTIKEADASGPGEFQDSASEPAESAEVVEEYPVPITKSSTVWVRYESQVNTPVPEDLHLVPIWVVQRDHFGFGEPQVRMAMFDRYRGIFQTAGAEHIERIDNVTHWALMAAPNLPGGVSWTPEGARRQRALTYDRKLLHGDGRKHGYVDVLFDKMPDPETPVTFIEAEDQDGWSVSHEWVERENGCVALRIPTDFDARLAHELATMVNAASSTSLDLRPLGIRWHDAVIEAPPTQGELIWLAGQLPGGADDVVVGYHDHTGYYTWGDNRIEAEFWAPLGYPGYPSAGAVEAGKEVEANRQVEVKPSIDALRAHLISEHAHAGALDLDFEEAVAEHLHEHQGPGTIRNHSPNDLHSSPEKVCHVLAETRPGGLIFAAEREEEPIAPAVLGDLLLLVDVGPPLADIEAWTDEQRDQAMRWASATHLSASDNDDVEVPPRPEFLVSKYDLHPRTTPCATCHFEIVPGDHSQSDCDSNKAIYDATHDPETFRRERFNQVIVEPPAEDGSCPSHGPHPHEQHGGRCLDCQECAPAPEPAAAGRSDVPATEVLPFEISPAMVDAALRISALGTQYRNQREFVATMLAKALAEVSAVQVEQLLAKLGPRDVPEQVVDAAVTTLWNRRREGKYSHIPFATFTEDSSSVARRWREDARQILLAAEAERHLMLREALSNVD